LNERTHAWKFRISAHLSS